MVDRIGPVNRTYWKQDSVLNGLLFRGGYRTANLRALLGKNFNLELGFVRRIEGAMISPDGYPGNRSAARSARELAVWENEGGSIGKPRS